MNENIKSIDFEKKDVYKKNEQFYPTWEQQLFIAKCFYLNKLFKISGITTIEYVDNIKVSNEGDSYNFMPSVQFDTKPIIMDENYDISEAHKIIKELSVIDDNIFQYATEESLSETNHEDYESKVVNFLENFLTFGEIKKDFFYNHENTVSSDFMSTQILEEGIYSNFLYALFNNEKYEYNIDFYGNEINILPTTEDELTLLLKTKNDEIKRNYLFNYFINYFKDMLCNNNYEQEEIEIKINREEKLVIFEKTNKILLSFNMEKRANTGMTYPLIKDKSIKYPLEKENLMGVIKYFGTISGYYSVSEKEIESLSVDIIAEKLEADKNYLLKEMKEQLISTKKIRL